MSQHHSPNNAADAQPGMVAVTALFLAFCAWLFWLFLQSLAYLLPTPAEPALAPASQVEAPIQCLSYAPFRRPGQAPWLEDKSITQAQIEEDLRLLKPLTGCVRTYGVDLGLYNVPAAARAVGMRVMLGVWIGRDEVGNRQQLDKGLALAREYPDVVELLVVGNEVLLRREQSPEGLARWLAEAKAASPVPIAYADVWEFWQRHASVLRPHVDVVAAHILPYWEDEPVAVEHAIDHVHDIAAQLDQFFAPLPVLIAETGWPAAGRQRGAAVPGEAEQIRFVRELVARPLPRYNLIEAFDQPWKRRLEGAMGGYWGMLTSDGVVRVKLDGPTPPDARVPGLLAATAVGLALGAMLGALLGAWPAALLAGLAGGVVAPLALLQWQMLQVWSRTPLEWTLGGLYGLLALGTALLAMGALAGRHAQPSAAGRRGLPPGATHALQMLQLALLFATAWLALGLVFDARYRPLVWPMLMAPAFLLLLLSCVRAPQGATAAGPGPLQRWAVQTRWLAGICLLAAPLVVLQEEVVNGQAWLAAVLWVGLGLASWRQAREASGPGAYGGATHAQPASNTASVPRSVE